MSRPFHVCVFCGARIGASPVYAERMRRPGTSPPTNPPRCAAQATRGTRLTRTRRTVHWMSTFRARASAMGSASPSHPAMTPEAPALG